MWKNALGCLVIVTASTSSVLGQDLPGTGLGVPNYTAPATNLPSPSYTAPTVTGNGPAAAPTEAGAGLANGCNNGCCPADCCLRGWFSGDYLMLFSSPLNLPITIQNPNGGTLLGSSNSYGINHGGRINTGVWICQEEIAMQSIAFVTFRNFIDVNAPPGGPIGVAAAAAVPLPGANFKFEAWQQIAGGEGNTLLRLRGDNNTRLYGLAGFKYLYLEEDITMRYALTAAPPGVTNAFDEFHTRNQFIGGQVGAILMHQTDKLVFEMAGKLAVGANYTQLFILGSNTAGAAAQAFTGPSNIGFYETTYFSLLPEVNINVGYRITERLTANIGYNFMFFINAWRAGDQMSAAVPPTVPFAESTYFLHGINFGATFRY